MYCLDWAGIQLASVVTLTPLTARPRPKPELRRLKPVRRRMRQRIGEPPQLVYQYRHTSDVDRNEYSHVNIHRIANNNIHNDYMLIHHYATQWCYLRPGVSYSESFIRCIDLLYQQLIISIIATKLLILCNTTIRNQNNKYVYTTT